MASSAELKKLVDSIKKKTGLSQEEISEKAGYGRKTLTQMLSKGENLDAIFQQLKLIFVDDSIHKLHGHGKIEKNNPKASFTTNYDKVFQEILDNLKDLRNGQTQLWNQGQMIRQDVAGVSNYLMLKDADWDPEKLRELKDTYYKAVHAGPGKVS